jgi:ADP-heptose:LPS heptosyltransferase
LNRSAPVSEIVSEGLRVLRLAERLLRGRPSASQFDLRTPRRFLFLEYATALGSNVHATPVFEALKRHAPDSVIMVACSRMAFEVFEHNPFIDYLVETPNPRRQILKTARFLRAALRSSSFCPEAIATNTGNPLRSLALLAILTAKAFRFGYTLAPETYDLVLKYDPHNSLIANNLRLIESLGSDSQHVEPRVAFSPKDLAEAQRLLNEDPFGNGKPRVAFITQTSPTQRKSWPKDRFVSVANYITKAYDARIYFVGTEKESAAIEQVRGGVRADTLTVAGKTTIPVLSAVLSQCDLAVTLDTGIMHIGRSVGLPMVILAPAWQPVIEWLPLGFDQYRIFKGKDIPIAPPDYIMNEIQAEEVVGAIEELFASYPASPASRDRRVERSLSLSSPQVIRTRP